MGHKPTLQNMASDHVCVWGGGGGVFIVCLQNVKLKLEEKYDQQPWA